MPAESGADAARLDADERDVLAHAELGGAYSAADTMSYDEVVEPSELRDALLDALELSAVRRHHPVGPATHHGILP
jgi:acetyl-CoA carboxylase carboxyltransferase component